MNSTLGSVVPLAMFLFLLAPKMLLDNQRPMITIPSNLSIPQSLFNHLNRPGIDLRWPPMTSNDLQWLPMTTDDYQWLPMTTDVYRWLSMTTNDYPMTIRWLSDDYPMTIRWLSNDYRWLSNDYPMTFRWLSDDNLMTIQWLTDDYRMTIQWQSDDYPMTIRWLSNDYPMTIRVWTWWYQYHQSHCLSHHWFCWISPLFVEMYFWDEHLLCKIYC